MIYNKIIEPFASDEDFNFQPIHSESIINEETSHNLEQEIEDSLNIHSETKLIDQKCFPYCDDKEIEDEKKIEDERKCYPNCVDDEQIKSCKESKYGCCPDNKSAKLSKNDKCNNSVKNSNLVIIISIIILIIIIGTGISFTYFIK